MSLGVVDSRPEHGVKRRLSGSGGRPSEETGRDVRLRAHFPQLTQGARRIFQEGKARVSQSVKRVCHLEFGVLFTLFYFYFFSAKKFGFVSIPT